jgi:hypothetical protein
MSGYRDDIICARCGHAELLDEIVKVFMKNKFGSELRKELEPLISKARHYGFGEEGED